MSSGRPCGLCWHVHRKATEPFRLLNRRRLVVAVAATELGHDVVLDPGRESQCQGDAHRDDDSREREKRQGVPSGRLLAFSGGKVRN